MKRLYWEDIKARIDGATVVQGDGNPLIDHVVTKRHKIDRHTLLFDLYRKSEIDRARFRQAESAVVVTNRPDEFRFAGDSLIVAEVADVDKAYWQFIDYYRNLFPIPIIGVTGTCGKTTTKEMIKHLLESRYRVQATYKSFNGGHRNHRYLLGIDDRTGAAVIEMGVDRPGDLKFYIKYFRPGIRILLNIDVYHLVGCKTPERYFKAKTEILHDLDPVRDTLIVNADDENIRKIDMSRFQNILVSFGLTDGCHFRATDVAYGQGGMRFTLRHRNERHPVFVPGYGTHNVYNALAAIAAAWSTGIDIAEACGRMASFRPVAEHLEFRSGIGGCTVIDDTWNVAPLSMAAALDVLRNVAASKTKIAVLGYMPQLGDGEDARREYAKIGEKAVEVGVDVLIVVGDEAKEIGRKALELGMDPNDVFFCRTGTEVYAILQTFANRDAVVLLKLAHRVMMEDSFREMKANLIV